MSRLWSPLAALWSVDRLAGLALGVLFVMVLLGVFGPWLPLGDPTKLAAGPRLSPPSWDFPFGTDELGRSFLPRVVEGIRYTFLLASMAVAITAVLGTLLGMLAAYLGRFFDQSVARFADLLFAFPPLLAGLLVAAVAGPGALSVITVISAATLPLFIRVIRSASLSVVERDFVVAASVAGASTWRIIARHILPNVLSAAIVQLTYALSIAMIIESALSFLGLGEQPPRASLGTLLRVSSVYLTIAPWLVGFAGLVLSLAIVSVNLLGDGLRDRVDPLKGRPLT
ncbi:MAG: ABC transporter permease [Kiloniellales bacterium]